MLFRSSFIQAIQFLIQTNVISIPSISQEIISDTSIPSWIKNNAGWWADGTIDDDSFIQAIQFLIQNGILTV